MMWLRRGNILVGPPVRRPVLAPLAVYSSTTVYTCPLRSPANLKTDKKKRKRSSYQEKFEISEIFCQKSENFEPTFFYRKSKKFLDKIWGSYNRVCIAVSWQPNFYLLRCHAAPRYWLQIVFPGSRDPRGCRDWPGFIFVIFGSPSSYIPAVKNAQRNYEIRRPRSKNNKNNKINCKLIFGSRLSCFPASAKKMKRYQIPAIIRSPKYGWAFKNKNSSKYFERNTVWMKASFWGFFRDLILKLIFEKNVYKLILRILICPWVWEFCALIY